jgi:hypothetical protein
MYGQKHVPQIGFSSPNSTEVVAAVWIAAVACLAIEGLGLAVVVRNAATILIDIA